MIVCKELDKTFETKEELFKALKENNNFEFWNLGHPHMEYKQRLGCKTYTKSEFLKRWNRATANFSKGILHEHKASR